MRCGKGPALVLHTRCTSSRPLPCAWPTDTTATARRRGEPQKPAGGAKGASGGAASACRRSYKGPAAVLQVHAGGAISGQRRCCKRMRAELQVAGGSAASACRRSYKRLATVLQAPAGGATSGHRLCDGRLLRRPWLLEERCRRAALCEALGMGSGGSCCEATAAAASWRQSFPAADSHNTMPAAENRNSHVVCREPCGSGVRERGLGQSREFFACEATQGRVLDLTVRGRPSNGWEDGGSGLGF